MYMSVPCFASNESSQLLLVNFFFKNERGSFLLFSALYLRSSASYTPLSTTIPPHVTRPTAVHMTIHFFPVIPYARPWAPSRSPWVSPRIPRQRAATDKYCAETDLPPYLFSHVSFLVLCAACPSRVLVSSFAHYHLPNAIFINAQYLSIRNNCHSRLHSIPSLRNISQCAIIVTPACRVSHIACIMCACSSRVLMSSFALCLLPNAIFGNGSYLSIRNNCHSRKQNIPSLRSIYQCAIIITSVCITSHL